MWKYLRKGFADIEWGRLLWHILPGMGMGYLLFWHWQAGAVWTWLCLRYQKMEEDVIGDHSYHDVRGYKAGFWLGTLLWLYVNGG